MGPITWELKSNTPSKGSPAAQAFPGNGSTFERGTYVFNFRGTPTESVETFRNYYPPAMNAFEAAARNDRADDLRRELDELFTAQNREPRPEHDFGPGDLPARHRRALSRGNSPICQAAGLGSRGAAVQLPDSALARGTLSGDAYAMPYRLRLALALPVALVAFDAAADPAELRKLAHDYYRWRDDAYPDADQRRRRSPPRRSADRLSDGPGHRAPPARTGRADEGAPAVDGRLEQG